MFCLQQARPMSSGKRERCSLQPRTIKWMAETITSTAPVVTITLGLSQNIAPWRHSSSATPQPWFLVAPASRKTPPPQRNTKMTCSTICSLVFSANLRASSVNQCLDRSDKVGAIPPKFQKTRATTAKNRGTAAENIDSNANELPHARSSVERSSD